MAPVTLLGNLTLDLGSVIIAHGLRRGVFGERTREDLLNSNSSFTCEPEYANEPVFLTRDSPHTFSPSRPLSLNCANKWLLVLIVRAGIHTGSKFACTLYAFRRAFATMLAVNFDREVGRHFMAHNPDSPVYATYDRSVDRINIAEAVLGEGAERQLVKISPAYTR